jgi:regulator of sigma E protease
MYLVTASLDLGTVWYIVQVAIGLGAVIFVHELGHFLVAKACGVKCEKFYVGFDVPIKIGPLRLPAALWRRRWGETEYGIGILPLGGYVKMLGQDDNPSRIAEEMQRSQVEEGETAKEIVGPSGEKYFVDPRSYLAKSVPQRMAIISAGVIMNVIFAFIFAVIAYGVGVPTVPCVVSGTVPGSPAWEEDLQPGDTIVAIAGKENPTFDDLRSKVTLADLERGVHMGVDKAGQSGPPQEFVLNPSRGTNQGLAQIGIMGPSSLRLAKEFPVSPYSPAARAQRLSIGGRPTRADDASSNGQSNQVSPATGFHEQDEIIRVNGKPVSDYGTLAALLSAHLDEPIDVTVQRGGDPDPDSRFAPRTGGEEITFRVGPRPLKHLGLVMEMGTTIVAVQKNSPAAEAGLPLESADPEDEGIQEGDVIQSIDGERVEDPFTLPYELRRRAMAAAAEGTPSWVSIVVKRPQAEGENKELTFQNVKLRVPNWLGAPADLDTPYACPPLGIAYHILNRVDRVNPGSPADKHGLRTGDQIVRAEFIKGSDEKRSGTFEPLEFSDQMHNWPLLMEVIQDLSPQSEIKLEVRRGEETLFKTLRPYVPEAAGDQPHVHHVDRGFNLEMLRQIQKADSFSQQVSMGFEKTVDSLLLVYRFLEKLITTQVPVTALGGPITIAKATYYSAFEGFGALLIFLTILSANLAVINFLPIPLLDGGHMVFLAYEGIKRRPPNERFVVAMHTIGFVFIISLMLFVIVLDLGLIKRNL